MLVDCVDAWDVDSILRLLLSIAMILVLLMGV